MPMQSTLNVFLRRGRRVPHEFKSLFRFSLRFNLSTRLWCIFSANFSYLSLSSFLARLSLIALIRCCEYCEQGKRREERIVSKEGHIPDVFPLSHPSSPFPWPSSAPVQHDPWSSAHKRKGLQSGETLSSVHAIAFLVA
jgi:hypothetical protein